jgi:hypothetical protein
MDQRKAQPKSNLVRRVDKAQLRQLLAAVPVTVKFRSEIMEIEGNPVRLVGSRPPIQ